MQVIPVAAGASCDLRTFNIASRSRAANFLSGYGSSEVGGVAEQQTVIAVTLDWLAERLQLPDVIKIDVEGAELEVLSGAVHILETKHPVILCEVSSDCSAQVTSLLRDKGYRIYDGKVSLAQRREVQAAPWATVAIAAQLGIPAEILSDASPGQ